VDHGAVLVLLLDELVENAVVVGVVFAGEEVIELDLADPLAVFRVVVIGEEGEVENGGVVVGLDQDGDVAYARQHAVFLDYVHPK